MKSFINKIVGIFRGPKRKEREYYTSQYRIDLYERFSDLVIEDMAIGGCKLYSVQGLAKMHRDGKISELILNEPLGGKTILDIASFMDLEVDKNILKKHLSPDKTTLTVKGLIGIYSDMWQSVEIAQKKERIRAEMSIEKEKQDADRKAKEILQNL